jgi:hypothetical protein
VVVKATGGPAFPVFAREQVYRAEEDRTGTFQFVPQQGMSLRDYFAVKALTGILPTSAAPCLRLPPEDCALVAKTAYGIADAMLAERAK